MLGDRPQERRPGREGGGKKLRRPAGREATFLYRLARELRTWDVAGLAATITIDQVIGWEAFYQIEPFGQDWRRSARMVALLATALGAKVKEDFEEVFLPTFDPSRPLQSEEEMLAELMKIPAFKKQKKRKGK